MGKRIPMRHYWQLCARGYLRNVAEGRDGAILASFRPLYGCFWQVGAYGTLSAEYEVHTGHAPLAPAPDDVTIRADNTVPWTITLVPGYPWPPNLPKGSIAVPILLVSYLLLAEADTRGRLIKDMVRQWELRMGGLQAERQVVTAAQAAGLEVEEVGSWRSADASSFWDKHVGTSPGGATPSPSPGRSRRRAGRAAGGSTPSGSLL